MAKLNEGDVIEGIFTIALSLYLVYGKVDKQQLNKIRSEVDTKIFSSGRFKYNVVQNYKRQRGNKPFDFFNVSFEMRLKPQSVQGAFGKDFEPLYKSSKDIGNIDKKVDQIIKGIENASFSRRATSAVNYFLDNSQSEIVTFNIIADGIAGESSGGAIKGDVTLEVYATKKGSTTKIISGQLPFSLKSESVTVANLSPYRGMLDIASSLGVTWDGETKYKRLATAFKGEYEQKVKFELINEMYDDLTTRLISLSRTPNFSDNAFDFLGKSIFGDDLADVVDIQSSTIKEITKEYFDVLKRTTKLAVKMNGKNLVFFDPKTSTPIFQLRTKLRKEANEAKFYLEVGKGIYAK